MAPAVPAGYGVTVKSGVYPKAVAKAVSAWALVFPPAISFWIMVLVGSTVTMEPAARFPPAT